MKWEFEEQDGDCDISELCVTLAKPIAVGLRKYMEATTSSPLLDQSDVAHIKLDYHKGMGSTSPEAWQWMLGQMIYAFVTICTEKVDNESVGAVNNGLRLFAKYYNCLWN